VRSDPLPRGVGKLTPPGGVPLPRWRLAPAPDPGVAETLASTLNLPLPLATLLVQRGHDTPESARRFLRPDLASLSDPLLLRGVATAVDLIADAVRNHQRILVHGDYDVDGQCATALLVRTLRAAGAQVHGFVPHRIRDGYDFGPAGIAEAKRIGAELIITADCGINAVEAVGAARAEGLKVVVSDHHLPGAELPPADAVIDPRQPGDCSGLTMLAGTGVAFKLAQALAPVLSLPANFCWYLLDLVALATIADVVPLVGENRVLVRQGLRLMPGSRWVGLRELIRGAGVDPEQLRAGIVGYVLGPRLNAAGRLADASLGLELLLTDDEVRAREIVVELEALNRRRQDLDRRMVDEAVEMVTTHYADPSEHRAIVLAREGWHPGVIGIAASRIVERFGRPTFLIALDGEQGKGSGRSIEAFNLHEALTACDDLLVRYGGHALAAGLTISADQVDAFRQRFNDFAKARVAVESLVPEHRVDIEVAPTDINDDLERWGRHLEPCGMGNPAPVFGIRQVRLTDVRTVGQRHLKARIAAAGTRLDAIAFGCGELAGRLGDAVVDLAFKLERNEWQGRSSLQARVVALDGAAW
jgi:single-stranded-DNA-specific exonuclease